MTSNLSIPGELAILAIRLYRRLRPLRLHPRCIYKPTCTKYAVQAIRIHGLLVGARLAVDRYRRCDGAIYDGGYDPVPAKARNDRRRRCSTTTR